MEVNRHTDRETERELQTFISQGGNGSIKVRGEEIAATLCSYCGTTGISQNAAVLCSTVKPLEIQGDPPKAQSRGL